MNQQTAPVNPKQSVVQFCIRCALDSTCEFALFSDNAACRNFVPELCFGKTAWYPVSIPELSYVDLCLRFGLRN